MAQKLHIDIETYSSVDLKSSGVYKYVESIDFEILMVAYAFDDYEINIVDLAQGEKLPQGFIKALHNPDIEKHAHNANFERQSFKQIGHDIPIEQWFCSMIKAAYCSLPLSLDGVSKALDLGDKGKDTTGKALIKYFTVPCKPTKVNGGRFRNFPRHDLEKWQQFKEYCKQDVEAERGVGNVLGGYLIPEFERDTYILDQEINDRGIKVDLPMAQKAQDLDNYQASILANQLKELTGLENPNSAAQLKGWLSTAMQKEIKTLAKDTLPDLIKEAGPGTASDVLSLRKKASKSSTKKYTTMLVCTCDDHRARGLFQFYGANRTGRWAGRLIQMQNLPQNHIKHLALIREFVAAGDYDSLSLLYDDVSDTLSQLIRTAFIAKPGYTFAVADFSAIEARVIAWLAGEQWRLDVFRDHGKIYEASASMMFNVPIEEVTKGSSLRAKGKVAELALGYQGAVGALTKMGGEKMGLSVTEMETIVSRWREANPSIVKLWRSLENAAKQAIRTKKHTLYKNLVFYYDGVALTVKLPSGRKLFYWKPSFTVNKFKQESIKYQGMNQETKQWGYVDTYGGKLTENVIQAISRDLLAEAMKRLKKASFDLVMHVHDENIAEVPTGAAEATLERMCNIMGETVPWAKSLPLTADGYVTPFYKKD